MQFQRLKVTGFKSFVDAVDFRIEPGLTGVVGPNGCGKSNLLEALRWVMGANSAKAMRAEGMDDVIFGGSTRRASRNHAEVRLEIDNADRTAPARFNDHALLEVVRRIDRGAGSTYRVNSVETRARDVQLLFADASTGANSPALVRQGQISELIGAKPSNRRRILEEAAGVSGLHARRHEAGLRLQGAEANLERLGDVHQALETALARLKREARQAERYKRLSAEIRALQGAALHVRWAEAKAALDQATREAREAAEAVELTAREAAQASARATGSADALPALRDEAQIAAAVLQRLTIEADRVERDVEQAAREVERLKAEGARIAADLDRQRTQALEDKGALDRLARDLASLEAAIAEAPHRVPELEAALGVAEAARAGADAEVERIASEGAAESARRAALASRAEDADARRRAADRRLTEAEARLARIDQAITATKAERAALAAAPDAQDGGAAAQLEDGLSALRAARAALEAAEAERSAAQAAEAAARVAARELEERGGQLRAEAKGLSQLARPGATREHAPALDRVTPARGYEAALAAALGEELEAALDPAAAAHWVGASVIGVDWPAGAAPLSPLVEAPPELAARLARVAVVERAQGERLRTEIPPGARLVSREGDLWRWDGYTVRAEAPKPAAVRLAQRARLAEVEAALSALAPDLAARTQALQAATNRLRTAEDTLKSARRAPEAAERAVAAARDRTEQAAREQVRREARLQASEDTVGRLSEERAEAEAARTSSRAEAEEARAAAEQARRDASTPEADPFAATLRQARLDSAASREAEAGARVAMDGERRAREGRVRRRESLLRDQTDWRRRADSAAARVLSLEADAERAHQSLRSAERAPGEAATRRQAVMDQRALAEARHRKAADALGAAEEAQAVGDRALRAADQAAARAREARAAADARLDAAAERLSAAADQIRQALHLEPEALGRRIAEEAIAVPPDPQGLETHLAALERDRDQLGAVNLLAEEEAAAAGERLDTMRRERGDLMAAISKLRAGVEALNAEGRERLLAAFDVINDHFKTLFTTLFAGGQAELRLVESDDPLEAGLEIYACPPGKRLAAMSLMSGGEQALTAAALIFAVFLAAPAPVCVLDEVDAPLDDANVDRFCRLLDEMRRRTQTRFIAITHNPVTMSRMDRLFGVTMPEPGVSQLVSVDLRQAEALAAA